MTSATTNIAYLSLKTIVETYSFFQPKFDWRFATLGYTLEIRWPGAIQDGKWHHAVLVIDRESGLLTGFLDDKEHPNPAVIPNHGAPIVAAGNIGAYQTGQTFRVGEHTMEPSGSSAWDCLKIYHFALTADQAKNKTCPVQ